MRGLIVAAPASGSGKTLVTLGLLRYLANSGEKVVSAKVGPDYIDPAFHAAASGQPCRNLDAWAMRDETLSTVLSGLSDDGELVVCEGVMGLFDGARVPPDTVSGSSADIARMTNWPVVLIVDVRAQAASAAAVVRGFIGHEPDVEIVGVIFNRIGGAEHAKTLHSAITASLPDIPVIGYLPRCEGLALPSRHLGLVQALEHPDLQGFIDAAAKMIADHLDVPTLLALARPAADTKAGNSGTAPLGQRIAIARDAAFAFSYDHLLDGWRAAGAEIIPFSPLADEAPAGSVDAVYLPGGYPELHAGRLAANATYLAGLRNAAVRGANLFGECGGYMVLGQGMVDAKGARHAMAGLLQLETSFETPRLHLGYRSAALLADGFLGAAGKAFRGHEFHYASVLVEEGGKPLFSTTDAAGENSGTAGLVDGNVAGSFIHLIDQETLPRSR